MKKLSYLLAALLWTAPAVLCAQDAATEERLNKLSAQIQDLAEARDAQNRKIDELVKAMQSLQQQLLKPNTSYASQEDVKQLADKLREVDRKRKEDDEAILKGVERELKRLGTALIKPSVSVAASAPPVSDRGYEYIVKSGDTLSVIIEAYREQGIKVTLDQILKANPGLVPTKMPVGTKVFIPAPRP